VRAMSARVMPCSCVVERSVFTQAKIAPTSHN
jgi:hypothetical protein